MIKMTSKERENMIIIMRENIKEKDRLIDRLLSDIIRLEGEAANAYEIKQN